MKCYLCKGDGLNPIQESGSTKVCPECNGTGESPKSLEDILNEKWEPITLPWDQYPIGTKARAVMGGYWIKTERGWKWFCGATFPTPGGDACSISLPKTTIPAFTIDYSRAELNMAITYSASKNLSDAISFACKKHSGQVDKLGSPYILHPLRVMLSMNTNEERIVAILHDVVEDTDATFLDLDKEGFSIDIIHAVESLTKKHGEDYENYLQRVVRDSIAIKVKLADLQDNLSPNRLNNLSPDVRNRLMDKYNKALIFINKFLDGVK